MNSPKFPQSNGQAERSVQTVKNLLKISDDPYTPLLSYRTTPLSWCDLSPAELSMGRRVQTSVPQTDKMLVPQWPYLKGFRELDKKQKQKQEETFDLRHCERSATYTRWYWGVGHHREWASVQKSDFNSRLTMIICCRNSIRTNQTKQKSVDCCTEREFWNESAAKCWNWNSS